MTPPTTGIGGLIYSGRSGLWYARGRDPLQGRVSRDGLLWGTYEPSFATTGLIRPDAIMEEVPPGTNGYVSLSEPYYENKIFLGPVVPKIPNIVAVNCIGTGGDPNVSNTGGPCIQNYGSNPLMITFIDCLLDPGYWWTVKGRTTRRRSQFGVHGGMFRLIRCEVTNVEDGVNHVGRSSGDPWSNETLVESCLFHHANYVNAVDAPDDGQSHNDAFQFNTGKNIIIRGNKFGGMRDMTGYRTWPGGYNSGDDFWNACLMIKQEVNSDPSYSGYIENVMIESNFLSGGTASINHASSTGSLQTWATTTVRNNRIYARGSDWGMNKKTNPATHNPLDPIENPAGSGSSTDGYYILKHSNVRAVYSNNTIYETGLPAPIQNG